MPAVKVPVTVIGIGARVAIKEPDKSNGEAIICKVIGRKQEQHELVLKEARSQACVADILTYVPRYFIVKSEDVYAVEDKPEAEDAETKSEEEKNV